MKNRIKKITALALILTLAGSMIACGEKQETFSSLDEVLTQGATEAYTSPVVKTEAAKTEWQQKSTLSDEWRPYVEPVEVGDSRKRIDYCIKNAWDFSNKEYFPDAVQYYSEAYSDSEAEKIKDELFALTEKIECVIRYTKQDENYQRMQKEFADIYSMDVVEAELDRLKAINWTGQICYSKPMYVLIEQDKAYVFTVIIYNDHDGLNVETKRYDFIKTEGGWELTKFYRAGEPVDITKKAIIPVTADRLTEGPIASDGLMIGLGEIDWN